MVRCSTQQLLRLARRKGIRGRKPSIMTTAQDGELVDNAVFLQNVETILEQEFLSYGYKIVCDELKDDGWVNHQSYEGLPADEKPQLFVQPQDWIH